MSPSTSSSVALFIRARKTIPYYPETCVAIQIILKAFEILGKILNKRIV
jgi:hypothetical protein